MGRALSGNADCSCSVAMRVFLELAELNKGEEAGEERCSYRLARSRGLVVATESWRRHRALFGGLRAGYPRIMVP